MELFMDECYFNQQLIKIVTNQDQLLFLGTPRILEKYLHSYDQQIQFSSQHCQHLKECKHIIIEGFLGGYSQEWLQHSQKICQPHILSATDFQKQVWQEITEISWGMQVSYSELAYRIGNSKAFRAVSRAVALNPILIFTPCHRIIPKAGGMGQYSGGKEMKEYLLKKEAGM